MSAGLLSLFMLHQHLDILPGHRALGDAGLDIHACSGPRDLHARLHTATAPVCAILVAPDDRDAALLIAYLRASAQAGIIALMPHSDADHRIHTLLVGADLCLPSSVTARELAAHVLALQRRLGSAARAAAHPAPAGKPTDEPTAGAPPVDARWHLVNNDWELVSPDGVRVSLTHNERKLLGTLTDDPSAVLSRPELATALSDSLQEIKATSINMLVSRLRSKARHLGTEVPLGVLPGRGYTLTAPIVRPVKGIVAVVPDEAPPQNADAIAA